jgi:glycine/D-amino acid oxidase-like deaminating enzyme
MEKRMPIMYQKKIDVVIETDVLVCGTGCAGLGAAVAAARTGARIVAVDRCGFAGGFFTAIVGSAFDGFTDQRTGRPVVGGVVFEMLERMGVIPKGQGPALRFAATGEFLDRQIHPDWLVAKCDPECFKRAADAILTEAGVRLLYHTQVADVLRRGDRIDAVIVSNKAGLMAIRPKVVIDATGDGDVAAWAGVPYELAEALQPMSLHFRIMNVEPSSKLRERCAEVLARAHAEGRIGLYGGPWLANFAPNEIYVNAIRVPGNPINPDDVSRAEIQGRRDAWRMYELWKEALPEFADAYFMTSGPVAGARESRRIVGAYTLTEDDILERRRFDDVVVLGAWRLDQHPSNRAGYHDEQVVAPYDIPYRTLLPRGIDNLLVAGRCHAATSRALASSRVTATAMGMGQAAGTAAALALQERTTVHNVSITLLQEALLKQGAILETPP